MQTITKNQVEFFLFAIDKFLQHFTFHSRKQKKTVFSFNGTQLKKSII